MGAAPHVYVASPLGFAASTRGYLVEVLAAVRGNGLACLDPWDDPHGEIAQAFGEAASVADADARSAALAAVDDAVGRRNAELLVEADGVLAILDGVDVDSGTAAEIGYAAARGIPIVGVRTDLRRTGENDGCHVNLQVEFFIRDTGGSVVTDLREGVELLASLVRGSAA
jgi:nucleoside 2-deoxyribosyltransferase